MSKDYTSRRKIMIFGIIILLVVLSTVVGVFHYLNKSNDGTILFFVNGESIETKIENVDETYLNSLMEKVEVVKGYDYLWSYSEDHYEAVDMNNIKTGASIYIIKEKHVYNVSFTKDSNVEYEITSNEEYYLDNTLKFRLVKNDNYVSEVYLNGKYIEETESSFYIIPITGDLDITIKNKEIIKVSKADYDYIYNGLPQEFKYALSKEVNLDPNSISIKYYNDINHTDEVEFPVEAKTYYVVFSYTGDDYYIDDFNSEIQIKKGTPVIIKNPTLGDGYVGSALNKIQISFGEANVEGIFKWKFANQIITNTTEVVELEFIPSDNNYESISFEETINIITEDVQLRSVEEEVEYLKEYINTNDIYKNGLPLFTSQSERIDWLSTDTFVSINDGMISLIGPDNETRLVKLYGIVSYGNASEYVMFEYQFTKAEVAEVKVEDSKKVIYVCVETNNDCLLDNIIMLQVDIRNTNDSENEEIINRKDYKHINCYEEKIISSFIQEVSEIIVWKVISNKDKGSNDNSNNNIYLNL